MGVLFKYKKLTVALLGVFISSLSFCISLPILALYFKKVTGASAGEIGMALGMTALIASIGAIWGGKLSDRTGKSFTAISGAVICAFGYIGLLQIDTIFWVYVIASGIGVGRALLNPSVKAMVSDTCPEEIKGVVFKIRYILICLAFALGPVIGIRLYQFNEHFAFYGTSLILILFSFLAFMATDKSQIATSENVTPENEKVSASWRYNHPFLIFIVAGFCVFVVFSQFENVMPLALATILEQPEETFSQILVLNAVCALCFQIILIKFFTIENDRVAILIGAGFYAGAFALFAYSSSNIDMIYPATILFTLGEVFLFPVSEHLVDRSIPAQERGAYYGIAELRQLGFFAGPAIGGFILDFSGFNSLFLSATTMAVIIYILFELGILRSEKISREQRMMRTEQSNY